MSKIILEGISIDDLEKRIESIIDRKLSALIPKADQTYLTRADVCKLLQISEASLHRYTIKGILNPSRIGNRVYFTRLSIDKVLQSRQKN